jgi:hypothetical protein
VRRGDLLNDGLSNVLEILSVVILDSFESLFEIALLSTKYFDERS